MRSPAVVCSLLLGLLGALGGCATTQVEDVWRDPQFQGPGFARVLVAAVGREEGVRRRLEDKLVRALRTRGIDAAPSYRFIESATPQIDDLRGAVAAFEADGVLLTGAMSSRTRVTTDYYPSMGYGFGWGPWLYPAYGAAWGMAYAPVVDTDVIVQLPIDLYEVNGHGRLVWSGRSQSIDPSSLVTMIDDVAESTIDRLFEEGLLAARAPPRG